MTINRIGSRLRRAFQISNAFLRIGYADMISYPLTLGMQLLGASVPLVTFYFVARLVDRNGPEVGGDYFTFVVIGIIAMRILSVGLSAFGRRLHETMNQGQLEMYLVEPVRWRILPFVMIQWEVVVTFVISTLMLLVSVAMGAAYRWSGLPTALMILALGLSASLAIGILDSAIRILAKRADPILTAYTLAASVLSGTYYPLEVLPSWLRALSWLLPHTYVLQALRSVLMRENIVYQGPTTAQAVLALAAFSLVFLPAGLWLYGRSLEYGRKMGVLSGY